MDHLRPAPPSPVTPTPPPNHLPIDLAATAAAGLYSHHSPPPPLLPDPCRRSPGMPPPHPPPRVSPPYASAGGIGGGGGHCRSLSQPPFFSLDALPPLTLPPPSPSPPGVPERNGSAGLPPRRAHRRSQSDVPVAFSQIDAPPPQLMKQEAVGFAAGDDLVGAYMDLDALDLLDSSELDDLDSRGSGTRGPGGGGGAESSESEAESCQSRKGRHKRAAPRDPAEARGRHCRSLSMDSFMEKLNSDEFSPNLLPSALEEQQAAGFRLGASKFTDSEKNKIAASDRLVEMALTDPKRVKRILANRQSAARSKERKMRYIKELESKVQILQTEATTLSAQLTSLQRDSIGLASQNNELKIRLQAMEQQAQLKDALNEALTAEVRRLRLATGGDTCKLNGVNQLNTPMNQLHLSDTRKPQERFPPPQQ